MRQRLKALRDLRQVRHRLKRCPDTKRAFSSSCEALLHA
jgi:hypothetical protein